MFPSSYEDDITTLLEGNALSIPVHRGNFVPSADQARSTHRQGYVVWDEDSMQPHVCSEGYGDSSGKQVIDFYLDIIVYANTAAKRRYSLGRCAGHRTANCVWTTDDPHCTHCGHHVLQLPESPRV
jgi:hypothetical protein